MRVNEYIRYEPEFTELREIIDRTSRGRMILAEGV